MLGYYYYFYFLLIHYSYLFCTNPSKAYKVKTKPSSIKCVVLIFFIVKIFHDFNSILVFNIRDCQF